jgi:hypothetical protein
MSKKDKLVISVGFVLGFLLDLFAFFSPNEITRYIGMFGMGMNTAGFILTWLLL